MDITQIALILGKASGTLHKFGEVQLSKELLEALEEIEKISVLLKTTDKE